MVAKLLDFINMSWQWLPINFVGALTALICFKFADSMLGIIDRAWRILGR